MYIRPLTEDIVQDRRMLTDIVPVKGRVPNRSRLTTQGMVYDEAYQWIHGIYACHIVSETLYVRLYLSMPLDHGQSHVKFCTSTTIKPTLMIANNAWQDTTGSKCASASVENNIQIAATYKNDMPSYVCDITSDVCDMSRNVCTESGHSAINLKNSTKTISSLNTISCSDATGVKGLRRIQKQTVSRLVTCTLVSVALAVRPSVRVPVPNWVKNMQHEVFKRTKGTIDGDFKVNGDGFPEADTVISESCLSLQALTADTGRVALPYPHDHARPIRKISMLGTRMRAWFSGLLCCCSGKYELSNPRTNDV